MVTRAQDTSLFAYRMKMARERLGISQMELGVRAGIDEFSASARINQYERGKHMPNFATACNLAKVLGVPTAYFYAEDDNIAELIVLSGKLKSTDRKKLTAFAQSLAPETNKPNKTGS
ncbi:MAG: helix-turn-helix domain-containing protein [Burkholderiaceae bacterium]